MGLGRCRTTTLWQILNNKQQTNSLLVPPTSKRDDGVPSIVDRQRQTTRTTIVPVRRVGTVGSPKCRRREKGRERYVTLKIKKTGRNHNKIQCIE